jgi:hypothetical protein
MANEIYEVEELKLDDGSVVTLKPSPIKVLRRGTQMVTELGSHTDENVEAAEAEENAIHDLLDIVALCLKKQRPDFEHEVELENGTKRMVTNYELMEDLFNLPDMFYVIEKDLGVKLNDPKLLEETAAQVALMAEVMKENPSES